MSLKRPKSKKDTPRVRLKSRSIASTIRLSSKSKKRENKITKLVLGNKPVRNAISLIRRTEPKRQSRPTLIASRMPTITLRKPKENIKEKKSIFSRLKSIKQKLVGVKRNYLLPVGVGAAKRSSEKESIFQRAFGGAKKLIGGVLGTPTKIGMGLGRFGLGVVAKTKSTIGDWMDERKKTKEAIKEKGIWGTIVDAVKGEGTYEVQKEEKVLEVLEAKQQQTRQQQEQSNLIRNIVIGAGALGLGAILFLRKK